MILRLSRCFSIGVIAATGAALSCAPLAGIDGKPCVPGCVDESTRLSCDGETPRAETCAVPCGRGTCHEGACVTEPAIGEACGPDGEARCNEGYACIGPKARLSAIRQHTCLLDDEGRIWCWGLNEAFCLGDGTEEDRQSPVAVLGMPERAIDVSAGYRHTCAIGESGKVYCWGQNLGAQCGTGASSEPMVQPTEVELPGVRFTAVTAGATHTCALADDRLVYCWGMMTPDALSVVGPTRVEGLDDVRMIETVKYHTCAVRYSRPTLYCFGSNLFVRKPADGGTVLSYKLGPEAGDAPSSAAPVEVKLPMGVDVLDIGLGFESTFALGVNGVIYSWGYNTRNMLGTGSTEDFVPTPAPVMIDDPRYTVARVLDTAVEVLRSDGSDQCAKLSGPVTTSRYVCWGRNDYGELGFGRDGGFTQPFAKETVIPEAARDLVRGEDHGCFLMEVDGVYQVWCYGRAARVGNGAGLSTEPGVATPNQPIPAPVVWNPPEVVSEPE